MPGFWKPAAVARTEGIRDDDDFHDGNREDVTVQAAYYVSSSSGGGPLAQQRMMLPIYKHKKQILYAVEHYSVVVIVGETGSGKSTQIPQYLVETGGWASSDFSVIVTQPRRIAAMTLAQRVAQEANTGLGERVGYTVRFDDKTSPNTQIKFLTDGMLLREATLSDPLLSKYSVVMVDEAHERNLNSDAVLGLLKKIRRKRKNNLRIIVCSATIDAPAFLDFFVKSSSDDNKNNSRNTGTTNEEEKDIFQKGTIISVDGRQHSVDILHLEQPAPDYIQSTVQTMFQICHSEGKKSGDILCFLPSGEAIDTAIRLTEEELDANPIHEKLRTNIDLLPLYGNLPFHMQARVFQQPSSTDTSPRRVIFATNIAETSVTVPNISHVIDSGLVKLPYFDPRTCLERLIVGATSQDSARQRAGRSGRVQSGKCYRLYTEQYFLQNMKPHTPPEMLRANLTSFILTLKALGVDNILAFDLMDVPSVDALSHGLESLYALGAIDDKTQLTDLGMDMSCFPTEPRVSRMLLESLSAGCSWEVLAVASALQTRDLFVKPRGSGGGTGRQQQLLLDYNTALSEFADPSGDHVTYANLLAEIDDHNYSRVECQERFLNYVALQRALDVRKQLAGFLRRFGRLQAAGTTTMGSGVGAGPDDVRSKAIRRCVTAGFFFNVAKLANDGRYYTLRKNIPVTPSSSSVLSNSFYTSSSSRSRTVVVSTPEYIIFGETYDGARGGIELRGVSAIEARWLRELAPHYWE